MGTHANRRGLAARLAKALEAAALAFCKLARMRFQAPWRESRGC